MLPILVVSPQTMIGMSLQDEYNVTAVSPADLTPQVLGRRYAVTVLDAADLEATLSLLAELPRDQTGPLLLLAHDESAAAALDAAKTMRDLRIGPPLSGPGLRDCLHGLAQVPTAAAQPPPQPAPAPAVRATVPDGLKRDGGELQRRLQGRTPARPSLERAGTPADLLTLSHSITVDPPEVVAEPKQRGRSRASADRTATQMASTQTTSTVDLVDDLLSRVPGLLSLRLVSQAVVDDACARLSGSAAVVLVKDGEAHGVTAGVGLRPLELRLQLGSDHWLVREVVVAGHGLVVEDTDIARRDLAGAPLAAAQHLVAVPVPAIGGLIMVARDGHGVAFSHTDLATLARLAAEAGPPLREALALQDLARRLNDLAE